MRLAALACLVALALVAGCAKPAVTDPETPAALQNNTSAPQAPTPAAGGGNSTAGNASAPPPTSGGNGTVVVDCFRPGGCNATPPGPPIAWATPDAAKIRPGVQVITASDPRDPTATPGSARECTSNFVYTTPDNASVFLGIAAHCVSGLKIGDAADIGPGVAKATIAYSSWYVMNNSEVPDDPAAPAACANEKDAGVCDANDFALVKLAPLDIAKTNPAMLHFGGPVGLADSSKAAPLDKILTYGNSDLRQGVEPIMEKEGYLTENAGWTLYAETQYPVLPGDSGSAVVTADGHALGIVVTSTLYAADPFNPPTTTGITTLDHALQYAKDKGGLDVRVATWQLLDPGMLPAV